jgi:hypothetical protein
MDTQALLVDPEMLLPCTKPRVAVTHDEASFNPKAGVPRPCIWADLLRFYALSMPNIPLACRLNSGQTWIPHSKPLADLRSLGVSYLVFGFMLKSGQESL